MSAAAATLLMNPFPGLRPFKGDEEHLFFGRENQVDAMVDKLAETQFLAVVGTSGSGKSSLVNCGLRPALHQGLMARAGTAWRMAQFRPGNNPVGAMARALAQDGVLFHEHAAAGLSLAEIIETTLRMSKLGLIDICEQAALDDGVNLLVVVDQFEELFRYRQLGAAGRKGAEHMREEATAFVNLLLEVKEQAIDQIYIVLTMRSDFLGDCTQFPGLAEAINAGQYLVPRMTRDERRAAIKGPVGVGGAEITPVLLTRLVNDVGDNPDQLSILQHALNRTWACWQDEGGKGPLDLAHYEAIGTMGHALDQHAEQAYAELRATRQQQICEKLFKALTDKATDPRGTRRPTVLGELCALTDATAAEVADVIAVFRDPSRSFLMPPAGEALEMETVIDISHESLMRVWKRLIEWADQEAESAQCYRRLADTADRHTAGKANLLRDPELQLILDWREKNQPSETWASRYHPGFASVMRFLTESSKAREAERAERQRQRAEAARQAAAQAQAEAKAASANRVRNLWRALSAVAVLAIVFLGLLAYQLQLRHAALARQAEARQLAAKAEDILEDEPERGTLVAIEAAQVTLPANESVTDIAGNLLQRFLDRIGRFGGEASITDVAANVLQRIVHAPHAEKQLLGLRGAPTAMYFSPDGTRLVATSWRPIQDRTSGSRVSARRLTTMMWDVASGSLIPTTQNEKPVSVLAFSADGRRFATAVWGGTIEVFDTASETKISTVVHDKVVTAVFSPDGQRLATAGADGTAKISDVGSGNEVVPLVGQGDEVTGLTFSADGNRLAALSREKITVWEVPSRKSSALAGQYHAGAFSPDGELLAAASSDGFVHIWNVANVEYVRSRATMFHTERVWHVAFSPSSSKIATASDDGTTRIWDVGSGIKLLSLNDAMVPVDKRVSIRGVAFSPDGNQVATANADGRVSLWAIASHTGKVLRIVFSADGRWLATSGVDETVKIWDADNRRLLGTLGTRLGKIYGLTFSSDGTQLMTASNTGRVTVWDLTDLKNIQPRFDPFQSGLAGVIDIAWPDGKDGKRLVMAGETGVAEVRDPVDLHFLELFGGPKKATAFALSADGRRLATVSPEGDRWEIWNKGMKNPLWSFDSGEDVKIKDVVLSPDGRYVASVSEGGLMQVWDAELEKLQRAPSFPTSRLSYEKRVPRE